jgi:DNA-binding beta-propeller fold protein YncE
VGHEDARRLKTIDVQGNPDGILFDPFNQRVWCSATARRTRPSSTPGTDRSSGRWISRRAGAAVTDGNGHIYVDIEDKDNVAVVDTRRCRTAHYDISEKARVPAGLAFDVKNQILFVGCRTRRRW